MEIIRCDDEYKGKELVFHYVSEAVYEIEKHGFCVSFQRKLRKKKVEKVFVDVLLSDWLENPELYRIEENGIILGFLELSKESWNNRLRISNLWVDEACRHQGIGSKLMAFALKRAKDMQVRAVVLETQSCNDVAISFYLKCGFDMIGFDIMSYSNEDIENKEVRIEMGMKIEDSR